MGAGQALFMLFVGTLWVSLCQLVTTDARWFGTLESVWVVCGIFMLLAQRGESSSWGSCMVRGHFCACAGLCCSPKLYIVHVCRHCGLQGILSKQTPWRRLLDVLQGLVAMD